MQLQTSCSGSNASLAELYQRHAHTLLKFIRHYVSRREDAEDVLLEVFLAACENDTLANLREGEQLAWLRRVARNKCVDTYRHAQRHQAVSLGSVTEFLYEDEGHAPEQVALLSEEHALLRSHLAKLPQHYQAILRLRFAQGLRVTEIARQLDKSEGSVRTLLSRSLNLLRRIYARQAQGGNEDE